MTGLTVLAVGLLSLGASWLATAALLPLLRRGQVLDRPNARSSHAQPTPRGGGLAMMPVVLLAWLAVAWLENGLQGWPWPWPVLAVAAGLSAVCFLDDLSELAVPVRLLAQAGAVGVGLAYLPLPSPAHLNPVLFYLVSGLLWLWFVNLYNFMDGIDGLAGVETFSLGLGIAAVALAGGLGLFIAGAGAAMAGAALGFLCWNWQPARVFLGDVGSVGLGYLAGFLLLQLALAGHWAAAVMLPLYYLADASITLGRRFVRGEPVWRAHREHYYQRAAAALRAHAPVSRTVLVANLTVLAMVLLVILYPGTEWLGLAMAAATIGIVLTYFARLGQEAGGA